MSDLPESIPIKEAFEFTLKLFKEQQQELTNLKAKYEKAVSAVLCLDQYADSIKDVNDTFFRVLKKIVESAELGEK